MTQENPDLHGHVGLSLLEEHNDLFLGELALPHIRDSPDKRTPSRFAWYGTKGAGQEEIRVEAGLPQLRLHDLRHQFTSFLVNCGRGLYVVQKILWHSSHSVTERYAHLNLASLMDASNNATAALRACSELTLSVELYEVARIAAIPQQRAV